MAQKKYIITNTCPICGRKHEMEVTVPEMRKYSLGRTAQESFKSSTPEEIERIVTHLCSECQKEVFKV